MNSSCFENFYVYRSLHSDESWGAIIVGSHSSIPNCDFLIKVEATNEREAITKGKTLYDKIHKFDSVKSNVKYFAGAALKSVVSAVCDSPKALAEIHNDTVSHITRTSMRLAIAMNREYEQYFESIKDE